MAAPSSAPGVAKEPRPASHFRLSLGSFEGTGVYYGKIRPDTITLREIAPRQVMTFKAGQKLQKQFPTLRARIADTFTKSQADARFLLRTEAASLLAKTEAEQTYAKKSETVAGDGSVRTAQAAATGSEQSLLQVPGFGEIRATSTPTATSIALHTTSTEPILVSSSERGGAGSAVSGDPYEAALTPGLALTLQLIKPGSVASVIISMGDGSVRLLNAQAYIGP